MELGGKPELNGHMANRIRDEFLTYIADTGISVAEFGRRSGVSYNALVKLKSRPDAGTSDENAKKIRAEIERDQTSQTQYQGQVSRVENGAPAPGPARLVRAYDVRASAGDGTLVGYEAVDYSLAFPPDYMRRLTSTGPENLAIIGVVGDSMLPTLKEDDIVMVDRTKTNIDYDGMFVVRIGDVLKVKRMRWAPGREKIVVLSDNRDKYPAEQYDHNDGIEVIGRVIWAGGKV